MFGLTVVVLPGLEQERVVARSPAVVDLPAQGAGGRGDHAVVGEAIYGGTVRLFLQATPEDVDLGDLRREIDAVAWYVQTVLRSEG